MSVPVAFDWMRPTASKLRGIVDVSEERNRWVRGRFVVDPFVVIEMSFERVSDKPENYFPGTNLSYIGVWCEKRCIMEFQLGKLVVKPDLHRWSVLLHPLLERLQGYYPPVVSRSMFER